MALDWSTVSSEHVRKACEILAQGPQKSSARVSGLFLLHGLHKLQAKQVVRVAYCLANNLPKDSKLKFSSGDATLHMLERLGFAVERVALPPKSDSPGKAVGE